MSQSDPFSPRPVLPRMTLCGEFVQFSHIGENTMENLINFWNWFIFVLISLLFIAQKAVKAQIIVETFGKKLASSEKNNFIDFLIEFHLINFYPKYNQNIEKKSMKWNLIRKSMKLFFPELGNIFFKICTIIWAFTAFWTINSKEMRAKINQYQKLMRFSFVFSPICENLTISSHTSILTEISFLGYFKSQISKCPDLSEILPYILVPTLPRSLSSKVILYFSSL